MFSKLCRVAEKKYFIDLFILNKTNIKQTWKLIKDCIGEPKTSTLSNMTLPDGTITTDINLIANVLNNHFNTSANFNSDSLNNKDETSSFSDFLINGTPNSFFFVIDV